MKSSLLLLALVLPGAALAVAAPVQQEPVGADSSQPAQPKAHRPLFEVRYVLLKAKPEPRNDALPRIDMGDGKASIHRPSSFGAADALISGSLFLPPNTMVCRGWGCMDQSQR